MLNEKKLENVFAIFLYKLNKWARTSFSHWNFHPREKLYTFSWKLQTSEKIVANFYYWKSIEGNLNENRNKSRWFLNKSQKSFKFRFLCNYVWFTFSDGRFSRIYKLYKAHELDCKQGSLSLIVVIQSDLLKYTNKFTTLTIAKFTLLLLNKLVGK